VHNTVRLSHKNEFICTCQHGICGGQSGTGTDIPLSLSFYQ